MLTKVSPTICLVAHRCQFPMPWKGVITWWFQEILGEIDGVEEKKKKLNNLPVFYFDGACLKRFCMFGPSQIPKAGPQR